MVDADVTFVLAPIDQGVRTLGGRDGAALGPARLMAALRERGLVGPDTQTFEVDVQNTEEGLEADLVALADAVEGVLREERFPVVLGGDHGITYGTVAGLARVRPAPVVVYVDVHLDMRPCEPHHTSGSSFRRVVDEGIVEPSALHPVGIQRPTDPAVLARARFDELDAWASERAIAYAPYDDVLARGLATTVREHVESAADACCLSFDIDALDEAHAPGVSAPGPGRFQLDQALEAVRAAAPLLTCFDLVEYAPRLDMEGRTLASAVAIIEALLTARR